MAEDALVESLLPELLWRFRVGGHRGSYKPVQMGFGMVTHYLFQLAARAVRRAGAKNIEGGDVTRGDVSSG